MRAKWQSWHCTLGIWFHMSQCQQHRMGPWPGKPFGRHYLRKFTLSVTTDPWNLSIFLPSTVPPFLISQAIKVKMTNLQPCNLQLCRLRCSWRPCLTCMITSLQIPCLLWSFLLPLYSFVKTPALVKQPLTLHLLRATEGFSSFPFPPSVAQLKALPHPPLSIWGSLISPPPNLPF